MKNPAHGSAQIIRADARDLPLDDSSVDLVVTSPPYFGLRSYQDGGEHYAGQLGDEPTPAAFVDALIEVTRECLRVLKPSGSMWINLGDKYATRYSSERGAGRAGLNGDDATRGRSGQNRTGCPEKSLIGIPWRYALRCIDDLGLILRAEVIWSKPNGLPESVTDRVRRSHETWFHFTKLPRYFSAVDEIREPHAPWRPSGKNALAGQQTIRPHGQQDPDLRDPLGKLPGSVWTIATQPLKVPVELGIDHFAAFPMEWPRRIIKGWSPAGICTACGEGRGPVIASVGLDMSRPTGFRYACACTPYHIDDTGLRDEVVYDWHLWTDPAPTRPAVVLDPFGGTGTTALLAKVLGRHGISVDMSADYCRLAAWRTTDPGQLAAAMQVPKPAKQTNGQVSMFEDAEVAG